LERFTSAALPAKAPNMAEAAPGGKASAGGGAEA
jgi:hypothetical protein